MGSPRFRMSSKSVCMNCLGSSCDAKNAEGQLRPPSRDEENEAYSRLEEVKRRHDRRAPLTLLGSNLLDGGNGSWLREALACSRLLLLMSGLCRASILQ